MALLDGSRRRRGRGQKTEPTGVETPRGGEERRDDRTRAGQLLQASEIRYRRLFETAKDGILILDADSGAIVDANPFIQDLLGFNADELEGKRLSEIGVFRDRASAESAFSELQTAGYIRYEDLPLQARDGRQVEVEFVSNVYQAGSTRVIQCNVRDVTERKRSEREIEVLSRLPAESPDVVLRASRDGVILYANAASAPLLEAWGCGVGGTIPGDWPSWTAEALRSGARREVEIQADSRVYDCLLAPIADGGYVNVYGRDVTSHKKLEKQLRESQKMEAVAHLAGGVAHDFNNLLAVITGYAELLMRQLPEESPYRHRLEQILKASDRATGLTKQLLAFGRRQVLQPRVLILTSVVAEVKEMLSHAIGEDIELVTRSAPDLWPVLADPSQIEQVLVNLAINARDAMPDGGRLTFDLANAADVTFAANGVGNGVRGPHVVLAVSDTGHGMEERTLSHLFEPFFTTKEIGKGTGLGLATVYGIVRQSGGHIEVESAPGRGSIFKVYLPRAAPATPQAFTSRVAEADQAALHGSETILLVEDETAVRLVVSETLGEAGYTLIPTSSPIDAVARARAHPGRIHLLLTDVIMPEMSGLALVERIRSVRPDVAVLLMSGYTDDVLGHVLDPSVHFIQKPFLREALLRKIRDVLAGETHQHP
jgi:two-component system, cell cycle sensor histidine kinase and response regulator CckA